MSTDPYIAQIEAATTFWTTGIFVVFLVLAGLIVLIGYLGIRHDDRVHEERMRQMRSGDT